MSASALIIAGPGSGHGKTLVTAGIARALLDAGKRLRVFKMGPDYLDPAFIEHATGLQVRQLDYWMQSPEEIANELARASAEVDHIIIEGVMGLFDGEYSVAVLAREFNIPVMVIADASAMAQTFGALMHGLASYDPTVNVAGVLANKVASVRHGDMLKESVRPPTRFVGWLPRDPELAVHERHLGIDGSRETAGPASRKMAEHIAPLLPALPWQAPNLKTAADEVADSPRLQGKTIAVARDDAFSFLYHANLDFLQRQGAQLTFFSPLTEQMLPACDALYLPGGYPELHLQQLSANTAMQSAVIKHIQSNKACVAECGGMLYLQQGLRYNDNFQSLCGIFERRATVQKKLASLGYQQLSDSRLRGHSFHYSKLDEEPNGEQHIERTLYADGRQGEQVFRYRNTVASYVHWYFSSDPDTICRWFNGN